MLQIPALWRAEARALLALAGPLILGNLAQSIIYATDLALLGQYSADALAAGTLAVNIYGPFMMIGTGLMAALSAMIAKERGAKKHAVREVRRTLRQGLWTAVVLALPCWLILWHAEAILRALAQEPPLAATAARFIRIVMWSVLPYFIFLVLRNYASAMERALAVFLVIVATIAINLFAGWVLIFGHFGVPSLGIEGAAIGSSISNLFLASALAIVVVTAKPFRRYRLFGRWWRADWPRFAEIWRLGLPIAGIIMLEVGLFNAAVFVMGTIDRTSLTAHAIAIQIAAFVFMVPMGIGQAATVRVGFGLGARDPALIARAGWLAFAVGAAFSCLTALALLLFPHALIGVFIDMNRAANAPIIAMAVSLLAVAALFQIADGAQTIGAGVLRGLHDTRWPLIYAVLGYWGVGAGMGLWLGFGWGLRGVGIWLGLASGLAAVAVLLLWRWSRREVLGLIPAPDSAA